MRILITNDDGINAPGLDVLRRIAAHLSDDVWVAAPEHEQSGAARSLTLSAPLRKRDCGAHVYAVQGTPVDCVMLAVNHLMRDHPPDLLLSGVNRGQNIAEDVTYSGTIAGAMEGALLGIPSIALSQAFAFDKTGFAIHWESAEQNAPGIIKTLMRAGIPKDVVVSVNFPPCAPDEVAGIRMARQGRRPHPLLRIEERRDLRGAPYYWLGFNRVLHAPKPGTDLHAVYNKHIAITPLRLDITDDDASRHLARFFDDG